MPWGRGRGYRWMYYITGMPGWMRGWYGLPAFGWFRGNPYPFCRWFPWLPRWWWSGIYGPVRWTPQGPVLASQAPAQEQPTVPTQPLPIQFQPQMSKEQETQFLEQELKVLEQDMESIKKRLEELRK